MKPLTPTTPPIPRLTIRASAGSGKTWQLSNRIIHLLLLGVEPSSLIALTFTRNAAGEFFDAVLQKLADASRNQKRADALSRDLELTSPIPVERFRELTLSLLYQLDRIRFGTLDSFFYRMVSSFSLELGMPARLQLMGTFEAQRHREAIMEAILHPRSAVGRAFVEAFQQATWGAEAKDIEYQLESFMDSHFQAYESVPTALTLPPSLLQEVDAEPKMNLPALRRELLRVVESSGLKESKQQTWREVVDTLLEWQPRAQLTAPASTLYGNILGAFDPATGRCDSFPLLGKRISWEPTEALVFGQLCQLWSRRALAHSLRQTQGIHELHRIYRQTAQEQCRRSGMIDYDDLTRLLLQIPPDHRQFMEYRIDQDLDHWLLDEFQDTSRAQWQAISTLVGEVIQDPEDRRTFFCVGDSKQSLYGWRGGDSRIYDEILARYGQRLETLDLYTTWRCSQPVVDLVNRICTDNPLLNEALPSVARRWNSYWHSHQSATDKSGHAAVYSLTPEDDPLATVRDILEKIDPLARGLSCAILSPRGTNVAACAEMIRRELNWPVVMEGREWIARDNPYGLILLASLRHLTHPKDSLAAGWLDSLQTSATQLPPDWRANSLQSIQDHGFAPWTLMTWEHLLPDYFGYEERKRQLLGAVRQFDRGSSRNPDTLFDFLESYEIRATESKGAIQCMTIHASKGLGFDVVILTGLDLANRGIHQRRDGPLIHRNSHYQPDWILEFPGKDIVAALPELSDIHQADLDDNAFEKWCLLYVGMTRAKQGLYLLTEPNEKTTVTRLSDLIESALPEEEPDATAPRPAPIFQVGQARWHEEHPLKPSAVPAVTLPRLRYSAPPPQSETATSEPALFSPAPDFGIEFHRQAALLHSPEAARKFLQRSPEADPIAEQARQSLCRLIESETGQEIFFPHPTTVIHVELSFIHPTANNHGMGRWDRIHLQIGNDSTPNAVTIYDFKTDSDPATLDEKYHDQMTRYRHAAAQIFKLPPDQIKTILVHVPA